MDLNHTQGHHDSLYDAAMGHPISLDKFASSVQDMLADDAAMGDNFPFIYSALHARTEPLLQLAAIDIIESHALRKSTSLPEEERIASLNASLVRSTTSSDLYHPGRVRSDSPTFCRL